MRSKTQVVGHSVETFLIDPVYEKFYMKILTKFESNQIKNLENMCCYDSYDLMRFLLL